MAFKLTKDQLATRDTLAAELRVRAEALNIAITIFNQGIEPLVAAVAAAQENYNEVVETARELADSIAETARDRFEVKSEKWQESDSGIQVRTWIEQWELSLEAIDLDLPEALEEVDAEDYASALADAPASSAALVENTHSRG